MNKTAHAIAEFKSPVGLLVACTIPNGINIAPKAAQHNAGKMQEQSAMHQIAKVFFLLIKSPRIAHINLTMAALHKIIKANSKKIWVKVELRT